MLGTLGRVQHARPATWMAAHLSKAPRASDEPHLDARKSSHITPVFFQLSGPLQRHKYCALHIYLRWHEPLTSLVSTRVSTHIKSMLSVQWTLCSDTSCAPSICAPSRGHSQPTLGRFSSYKGESSLLTNKPSPLVMYCSVEMPCDSARRDTNKEQPQRNERRSLPVPTLIY